MNTTEKLAAIRARCVELLHIWDHKRDHNQIYWASCGKQAEAGWRATIAAIDACMTHPSTEAILTESILTAWEGLI